MNFKTHKELEGRHAILAASKSEWTGYSTDKLKDMVISRQAAALGTRYHEFAKMAIDLGQNQPKTKKTLNMYINDCIGMRMSTEVVLKYSDWAFGTADAIRFDERTRTLYIFDLKTGIHEAKFRQLEVYAAFFCYEYGWRPGEINIELRIYQNDDVRIVSTADEDGTELIHNVSNHIGQLDTFTYLLTELAQGGV